MCFETIKITENILLAWSFQGEIISYCIIYMMLINLIIHLGPFKMRK